MKKRKISLFEPNISKKELEQVSKTLKSKFWASGAGIKKVEEFEKKFKKYTNSKDCIAVDSGTAALHLALSLTNVKNKEVLVPSLTFASTVNSIIYNEGIPVFVDIDPTTMCIDLNDLEKKITKKAKAILPVDFGGIPLDYKKIQKIAKDNDLKIIEDAAHACGTKWENKRIGSVSEFTCFSFHPVKNLSMPKGGAITINSKNWQNIKEKAKSLRWCGITDRKGTSYDVKELGYNYYMDEISATIGIEQLKKLDKMNAKRQEIAKRYSKEIKSEKKMPLIKNCSYHLFWILVKNRHQVIKKLNQVGIEVGTHYKPVHLLSLYKSKIKLKNTDLVHSQIITLPMHCNLKENEVSYVIKNVNSILNH
jgi:perosamine synthetase